jgi:Arm DNA-binding domain
LQRQKARWRCTTAGGLYLRVSWVAAKAWVFRYQLAGKRHDMGLGPNPDISLAEARSKAKVCRKQRYNGQCGFLTPTKAEDQGR